MDSGSEEDDYYYYSDEEEYFDDSGGEGRIADWSTGRWRKRPLGTLRWFSPSKVWSKDERGRISGALV